MIVVTIELWPHGDQARRRRLGEVRIANDATGDLVRGNYKARFWGARRRLKRDAEVKGFPRRSHGAFHLLALALRAAGF